MKAPASGSLWCRNWCACTAGRFMPRAGSDEGSIFTVSVPTGSAHLPAARVGASRELTSTVAFTDAYVDEALGWLPDGPGAIDAEAATPSLMIADRPARILLADDNADMRAYVRRLLTRHWEVEAVADGASALTRARQTHPDLIISDVMMPGLDGFGLLGALRGEAIDARNPRDAAVGAGRRRGDARGHRRGSGRLPGEALHRARPADARRGAVEPGARARGAAGTDRPDRERDQQRAAGRLSRRPGLSDRAGQSDRRSGVRRYVEPRRPRFRRGHSNALDHGVRRRDRWFVPPYPRDRRIVRRPRARRIPARSRRHRVLRLADRSHLAARIVAAASSVTSRTCRPRCTRVRRLRNRKRGSGSSPRI